MDAQLGRVLSRCKQHKVIDEALYQDIMSSLESHHPNCSWVKSSSLSESLHSCGCRLAGNLDNLAKKLQDRISLVKMNATLMKIKQKPKPNSKQPSAITSVVKQPKELPTEDSLFRGDICLTPLKQPHDQALTPQMTDRDILQIKDLQEKRMSQLLSECSDLELKILTLERNLKHTEVLLRDQIERNPGAARLARESIKEWSDAVRTKNLATMALHSSISEESQDRQVTTLDEVIKTSKEVVCLLESKTSAMREENKALEELVTNDNAMNRLRALLEEQSLHNQNLRNMLSAARRDCAQLKSAKKPIQLRAN